jgi:hypothetical protein
MIRKSVILITILGLAALFTGIALAGEEAKHEYVGAKKCKMCHKKDGIYPAWEATGHAKAWDQLSDEDKKNKDCIGCHSSGVDKDGNILEGVQCEACHGPGSDYKKKSVMEDREKAIAAGLLIPDEKTCLGCHNDKIPEKFRAKEAFDYAKMKDKGVHQVEEAEDSESDEEEG